MSMPLSLLKVKVDPRYKLHFKSRTKVIKSKSKVKVISDNNLKAGIYLFTLESEKGLVGQGKITVY